MFYDIEKLANEKDNEDATLIILIAYLLFNDSIKASNILHDFEHEISHHNRYFPDDSHIRKVIELFTDAAVYEPPIGTIINRARTISYLDLPQKTKNILENFKLFSDNLFPNIRYNKDYTESFNNLKNLLINPEFKGIINNIDDEMLHAIQKYDFWGYSDEESDAPPYDKATAGRANPNGISYLYAAENVHTAIVEARPIIGQVMSVAEIEIIKPLKIFDFCTINKISDDTKREELSLLNKIAERFSTPNYLNEQKYLLTQYIAEMLKKDFSFNGIRFQSSLHGEGKNIVLFNEHNNSNGEQKRYKVNNSSLHVIENISVCEYRTIPIQNYKKS